MNKLQIIKKLVGVPVMALALTLFAAGCEDSHPDNISSSEDIIAVSASQQVYPLTIRATKDAWKATSDVKWIQLSRAEAIGTRDIELIIEENTSDAARTGHVTVIISDQAKQIITVKQAGKGDTDVRVTPQLIAAGAYAKEYSFTLEIKDALASYDNITTEVSYLVGGDWIKNLTSEDAEFTDGHLLRTYTFTLDNNEMGNAREAVVNLTVKYGHSTYERTVKIYQNGLGTPAVATVENIYVRHNQTGHSQTIWLNDGDDSNVSYQVYRTSSQSGNEETDPAEAWIADAQIAGSELVLTFNENHTDEIREGDVYIIASRNNYNDYASTAKLRVHVTQSAHQSAGINMPVAEVAHNYTEATYTMPIQPVNNSKVSASVPAEADWITEVKVEDNTLSYSLSQYEGGQEGNFREATITLTADNGNANKAVYYMKVRQYAPEMPGISTPITKLAYTYEGGAKTMPIQPVNSATITAVSQATDWITDVKVEGNVLSYTLSQYQGGEAGNVREGVITLTASNDHADDAVYYLTIMQYAPELPAISDLPQYIGLGSPAQTGTLLLNVADGTTVTVVSKPDWVTAPAVNATLTTELGYTVTENKTTGANNVADYFREGVITLKASNAHKNTVYYYVTVRQYGRDLAYLTPATLNNYTWTAHCIGNSQIGSYSDYSPTQNTGWVFSLNNIPGTAEVKLSQNNNNFTINENGDNVPFAHSWFPIPASYAWGTTTITKSTVISIGVNAPPYVQTLTITATGIMTVVHEHQP